MIKVKLDKYFMEPVLYKRKVAFTLLEDNGLRRGDEFILVFDGVVGGRYRCVVDDVVKCKVGDVDFFMARAEGYVHCDLYLQVLDSCFGGLSGGSVLFQVYFKII